MRIVERRSHKFAQRFQELVGVSHQVCPFSLWQAIETGLMVAKEHKNVAEGLVVGGSRRLERDAAWPSYWKEMTQTECIFRDTIAPRDLGRGGIRKDVLRGDFRKSVRT